MAMFFEVGANVGGGAHFSFRRHPDWSEPCQFSMTQQECDELLKMLKQVKAMYTMAEVVEELSQDN